jgi:hypothetical protein
MASIRVEVLAAPGGSTAARITSEEFQTALVIQFPTLTQ